MTPKYSMETLNAEQRERQARKEVEAKRLERNHAIAAFAATILASGNCTLDSALRRACHLERSIEDGTIDEIYEKVCEVRRGRS